MPVGEERLDVSVRWRIVVDRPTSVRWVLAGPGLVPHRVEVDGVGTRTEVAPDGSTVLATLLTRSAVVTLSGSVLGDPHAGATVALLPAGTGTVSVPRGWVASGTVAAGPGAPALGAPAVTTLAPAAVGSSGGTLTLGETAVGLTVSEGAVRLRAVVRWRIARGELTEVAMTLPGAGAAADLAVTGPQVASIVRDGDRVRVTLREPERSLVALAATYSLALAADAPTASIPVPAIAAEGAFRTTSAVQLARDAEVDLVADLPGAEGWTPRSGGSLPAWARGLVEGTPTGAFVGRGGGGTITVARFVPADSPATLIDVAAYTAATTDEGRVLLRTHYAVRNDRGAVLRVVAPEGFTPVSVQVDGRAAVPARAEDGAWRVPLAKSVETVEGLLAFPVEIVWLGGEAPWGPRAHRRFALPAVDAPIAVARLSLHLPPTYTARVRPGQGDAVDAFTEGQGITYGFAAGDARAAQADQLFQAAVDAWKGNAFDRTAALIDELEGMGAANEDIGRLKSNLEVVGAIAPETTTGTTEGEPKPKAAEEVVLERRVLEQARARAQAQEIAQEEAEKKGDEARAVGDYAEAERQYNQALAYGKDLAKLRTVEDVEQDEENVIVADKLAAVGDVRSQKEKAKESQETTVTKAAPAKPTGTPSATVPPATRAPATPASSTFEEDNRRASEIAKTEAEAAAVEAAAARAAAEHAAGQAASMAAESPPIVEPPADVDAPVEVVAKEPVVTIEQEYVMNLPGRSGGGGGPFRVGKGEKTGEAAPVGGENAYVTDGADGTESGKRGERGPVPDTGLAVTAAVAGVVIPSVGQELRYQRQLVPAGATWEIPIAARARRGR